MKVHVEGFDSYPRQHGLSGAAKYLCNLGLSLIAMSLKIYKS